MNIEIDTPINPDSVDLHYSVVVTCGTKQVDFSVMVEYTPDESGDQRICNRTDITANAMESCPDGYDQHEIAKQVEDGAKVWTPVKIAFAPSYEADSKQPFNGSLGADWRAGLFTFKECECLIEKQADDDAYWMLSICADGDVLGEYEFYTSREDAQTDVDALELLGVNIKAI